MLLCILKLALPQNGKEAVGMGKREKGSAVAGAVSLWEQEDS